MKPLSTYYSDEVKSWLCAHPDRVVTQYQVAGLFGKAFLRAASMHTAVSGFQATGIWPVERNVFNDSDFLAAETTDIIMVEEPVDIPQVQPQQQDNVPVEQQPQPLEPDDIPQIEQQPEVQDAVI